MQNSPTPQPHESQNEFPSATPIEPTNRGQIYLRFHHEGRQPLSSITPYDIRQKLKPTLEKIGADFMEIAASQGENSITLYGLTPRTSKALQNGATDVMEKMANIAGSLLEVEADRLIPGISNDKQNWLHQITKLVVCTKKDLNWSDWRSEQLSPSQIRALEVDIRKGIDQALGPWGKRPSIGFLKVIDAGRPMVISPAAGPRVLTRLGVKFITDHLIEGALFIGPCNYLGMGRILRIAPIAPQIDESGVNQNV